MSRHAGWLNFFRTEKPVNFLWEYDGLEARRPLACPHCGGGNLHYYGFTVYESTEHENVNNIIDCGATDWFVNDKHKCIEPITFSRKGLLELGSLKIFSDLVSDLNPSAGDNRDGVVLKFSCETCSNLALLCLEQQKGYSLLSWKGITAVLKQDAPSKRKTIKPKLRFDILERDNHTCQACGATPQDGATLEIDHIKPIAKGGTDDPLNLQVLCRECNSGKGAR
jgi:hypothetical protein